MSKSYVVPDEKAISGLLEMIFGEGVEVAKSEDKDLAGRHVATFLNAEDELVALCVCDRAFVAYSGAALSMIPADVANEIVGGEEMTETLLGNYYEVMNICSKLMMSDTSAHLRLAKTLLPEDAADALAALEPSGAVCGFELDIPRYGKGGMSFVISRAA